MKISRCFTQALCGHASIQTQPERELQVEKQIFTLNSEVTDRLEEAKPFVFGMNRR
jgi:hypothetical protein